MDYFKLKKEDMIVWHFDKRTALVPSYYIVRDPKYNALCIIIRGTFVSGNLQKPYLYCHPHMVKRYLPRYLSDNRVSPMP